MKINACYTDQNATSLVESWQRKERKYGPQKSCEGFCDSGASKSNTLLQYNVSILGQLPEIEKQRSLLSF